MGAPVDPAPRWPSVSVVMPLRNSARDLRRSAAAALAQDYPGAVDVVLAVGPSQDGTEAVAAELAAEHARVRVVDNPGGRTAAALNAAIRASHGEVVARVDGQAVIPQGYLRRAVETLQATGADNVGGIQDATGETPFEQAVAAAMTSRFGVGNAAFHFGGEPGPNDTVYLGVFRRSALERVGGFDESLVRNQDYELNWRIRDSGGLVWFDPALAVRYRPRSSLRGLARQYFEYGQWKREVLRRHPRSAKMRQLAAPAAVVANVASVVLAAVAHPRWLVVPGVYAGAAIAASVLAGRGLAPGHALRLPVVFATMHHAWGAGFLTGPAPLRRRSAHDRRG